MDKENVAAEEFFADTSLSANMEDYMETIALLSQENRVVRVKDIAKSLKIKMPSVTAALGKLSEKGLIHYEKYGFVELTDEGRDVADRVYHRHTCLADFFRNVLRMDAGSADEEACRVEHHLSPESCRQIHKLVEFCRDGRQEEAIWTAELKSRMEARRLSELREGDEAQILKVAGNGPFRKRLMEMGFRKGERLQVMKYAPLKDPVMISIKGYNISLRVQEAAFITVKLILEEEPHA